MNDRYVSTLQTVAMRDGHENETCIFGPENVPRSGSPLIVLVPAGGFTMGTTNQVSLFAQSSRLHRATLNVTHHLALEHAFPTALLDIQDAKGTSRRECRGAQR